MKSKNLWRLIVLMLTITILLSVAGAGALAVGQTITLLPEDTPDSLYPSGVAFDETGVRHGGNIRAIDTVKEMDDDGNIISTWGSLTTFEIESSTTIPLDDEEEIIVTINGYVTKITTTADVEVAYIAIKASNGYTLYKVEGGVLRTNTEYILYSYWNDNEKEEKDEEKEKGKEKKYNWQDVSHVLLFGSGDLDTPPVVKGSLEITKTFTGLGDDVALPEGFKITVSGPQGYAGAELTLDDASGSNPYTWTLDNLDPGQYTLTEANADVAGYDLTVSGDKGANVVADQTATAEITNTYSEKPSAPELIVTKVFDGIQAPSQVFTTRGIQAAPAGFAATFQLQKWDEETADWVNVGSAIDYTDFTDRSYTFGDIQPGKYRVLEVISDYGTGIVDNPEGTEVGNLYFDTTTYSDDKEGVSITANLGAAITVTNKYAVKEGGNDPDPDPTQIIVVKNFTGSITTMPSGFRAEFQLQQLIEGGQYRVSLYEAAAINSEGEEYWANVYEGPVIYSDGEDNDFDGNSFTFEDLEPGIYRVVENITRHGTNIAASLGDASRGQVYWRQVIYNPESVELDETETKTITVTNNYGTRPFGGGGDDPTPTPEIEVEEIEEPTPMSPILPEPELEPEELMGTEEEVPMATGAELDPAPETGHQSRLGLWMLLALTSLFSLIGTLILRRKTA